MPNAGGRYVVRNGKRELVHNTKPTPAKPAKAADTKLAAAPVKTDTAAPKPAKAAAKQEVTTDE
ncbi:hypothetical protein CUU95_18215 [Vreelandella alkaliphila]|uniref:hypothetical protein n=1 Tax=Vreelandella alkaliphila TaxID=272774 RepID=UPI000EA22B23|nr:hypothetical protein [Halomonas alkaliphila]AYF35630.1 hypothetical protein CUU95_18215 [Halomonas alkaliphila]